MRIAQISTVCTPVCRESRGSVEQLVWLLARELTCLGHEITVFAAGGSETPCELVTTLPGPYGTAGSPDDWQICEWINLCRAIEQSGRFDVLHSHAYLRGVPLQRLARALMVHTMHTLPEDDAARLWSMEPEACVTAISHYQWSRFPQLRPAAVIHHGVDRSQFTFQPEPEEYVCFLGRFNWDKGALAAIAAARELGLRLLLAGASNAYYHDKVEPLVDGHRVEYVGRVSGCERNRLLGGARALLYPLQYPEPFGLVQVEAMMCGTPVIAMRLGAVPEIIDEGVTGYTASSPEEFTRQIVRGFELDRYRVREQAEARFSIDRMARGYAQVYHDLVSH